jgi:ABC-type dipeptide/oligopeptide/nickel transport system permease subunit
MNPRHAMSPQSAAGQRSLHRLFRSPLGVGGLVFLGVMLAVCLGTLPYTLRETVVPGAVAAGDTANARSPHYNLQTPTARHLPPWWAPTPRETGPEDASHRLEATAKLIAADRLAAQGRPAEPTAEQIAAARPRYWLGTDLLGRSLLIRCLAGGGISLTIGLAAAALSVLLGTLYGALAGYVGGRVDAVMMRAVDVLYGLPYILLVVLLAVASEAVIDEFVSRERIRTAWRERTLERLAASAVSRPASADERAAFAARKPDATLAQLNQIIEQAVLAEARRRTDQAPDAARPVAPDFATVRDAVDWAALRIVPPRELSGSTRTALDLSVLFVAIGGVSWLTMARVVRGQVLSLKAQPFMEAARAMGVPVTRQFTRHLLPNLVGPITVYATLTVPQAILQESFLSFLGIGVRPPLPSWGNLAAAGLDELNPYQSRWWLLLFPCLLLGSTLLALNFVGEGLREALDPKGRRR